jgi:transcriptional regulator with XRE-family HTH domain
MESKSTYYQNIRKIRELKGITRERIASELGLSASGYAKIERGESDISLTKLEKIATILGVDINTLINAESQYHIENIVCHHGIGVNVNKGTQNNHLTPLEEIKTLFTELIALIKDSKK